MLVADGHPEPDPTFDFDADPDPDPDSKPDSTTSFITCWKIWKKLTFIHNSASFIVLSFSSASYVSQIINILDRILNFSGKK